jgi:uncharacterized protein (DUF1697 family)
MQKYLSLLRGINVGGHKKVPMAELKKQYEKLGFKHVKTLLNSGNVVFEGKDQHLSHIPEHLKKAFGFEIPVITIPFAQIVKILEKDPFRNIAVTSGKRLYVTFLPDRHHHPLAIPYASDNQGFQLIDQTDTMLFSVLDLDRTGTPDAMKILEKNYGKNITTRNFNTIQKISKL